MAWPPPTLPTTRTDTTVMATTHPAEHNAVNLAINDITARLTNYVMIGGVAGVNGALSTGPQDFIRTVATTLAVTAHVSAILQVATSAANTVVVVELGTETAPGVGFVQAQSITGNGPGVAGAMIVPIQCTMSVATGLFIALRATATAGSGTVAGAQSRIDYVMVKP